MIDQREKNKQANVCTDKDEWEYGFAALLLACAVVASLYIHPGFQHGADAALSMAGVSLP